MTVVYQAKISVFRAGTCTSYFEKDKRRSFPCTVSRARDYASDVILPLKMLFGSVLVAANYLVEIIWLQGSL